MSVVLYWDKQWRKAKNKSLTINMVDIDKDNFFASLEQSMRGQFTSNFTLDDLRRVADGCSVRGMLGSCAVVLENDSFRDAELLKKLASRARADATLESSMRNATLNLLGRGVNNRNEDEEQLQLAKVVASGEDHSSLLGVNVSVLVDKEVPTVEEGNWMAAAMHRNTLFLFEAILKERPRGVLGVLHLTKLPAWEKLKYLNLTGDEQKYVAGRLESTLCEFDRGVFLIISRGAFLHEEAVQLCCDWLTEHERTFEFVGSRLGRHTSELEQYLDRFDFAEFAPAFRREQVYSVEQLNDISDADLRNVFGMRVGAVGRLRRALMSTGAYQEEEEEDIIAFACGINDAEQKVVVKGDWREFFAVVSDSGQSSFAVPQNATFVNMRQNDRVGHGVFGELAFLRLVLEVDTICGAIDLRGCPATDFNAKHDLFRYSFFLRSSKFRDAFLRIIWIAKKDLEQSSDRLTNLLGAVLADRVKAAHEIFYRLFIE